MKRQIVRLFGALPCLLMGVGAEAQPEVRWGVQFGTVEADAASMLTADGLGGVFVAGYTLGSLGGPNAGGMDVFVGRYNDQGDPAWVTQFGTSGVDNVFALAADGAGGVFVAGQTFGSLGGPYAGKGDAFLARYDGSGEQTWIIQFGTDKADTAHALTPDGDGGVFVAGFTAGGLGGPNAGSFDAFLARYDGTGKQTWMIQFGAENTDYGRRLAPDGEGGVFVTGETASSLGGPNAGKEDVYLARYNGSGDRDWIVQFGTDGTDFPRALASDGAGGVFMDGRTDGSLGGPNAGLSDAFLARHDGAGSQTWITQFGTSSTDDALALAPDGAGGCFVSGYTEGSLGGPNAGAGDAFLALYDGAGNPDWITQFGTSSADAAYGLASDGAEGCFVSGYTDGSLYGAPFGAFDAFLSRFGALCYPDLTDDGVLDLFDFLAFVNAFNAGQPGADCDGDQGLTLFDFLCFVNAFNAGC